MKTHDTNSASAQPWQKGVTAVHTFSRQQVTPQEHQVIIRGSIAVVSDLVDAARERIEVVPARILARIKGM